MNMNQAHNADLPVSRNLTLIYALSLIIAILMAAASITGLLYGAVIYPTDDLLQSFASNDVVNLFIGLPILRAIRSGRRRRDLDPGPDLLHSLCALCARRGVKSQLVARVACGPLDHEICESLSRLS